jgi:hypothetical protein
MSPLSHRVRTRTQLYYNIFLFIVKQRKVIIFFQKVFVSIYAKFFIITLSNIFLVLHFLQLEV